MNFRSRFRIQHAPRMQIVVLLFIRFRLLCNTHSKTRFAALVWTFDCLAYFTGRKDYWVFTLGTLRAMFFLRSFFRGCHDVTPVLGKVRVAVHCSS